MKTIQLKNDRYRKARGGYSRLLKIFCEECGKLVFLYQKDGHGIPKRLYLDRIYPKKTLVKFKRSRKVDQLQKLICPACKATLGMRTMYKKENRPVYRLFVGAIIKK